MPENEETTQAHHTPDTAVAPLGWYPDPIDPFLIRLWDGSNWTKHTVQNLPPISSTPNTLSKLSSINIIAVICLVLGVIFAIFSASALFLIIGTAMATSFWVIRLAVTAVIDEMRQRH